MKRAAKILLFCAALVSSPGWADYPERAVKIIVPYPAGQTTDVIARTVGQQLTESLGQSFFVDNRSGAGGIIGMEAAKRADADGYTLSMSASGPMAINPALYTTLRYDPIRDFTPIAKVAIIPLFLVVRADFPAANLKELIEYVKKNPGTLNYGSGGTGLTNHLTMEMFKSQAGLNLMHIPYRGAATALTALIAGDISMMFEAGPAIMPHVQSGALKVIAVGTKGGTKTFPDVPSVDQAGVPGFDAQAWIVLVAPAGTPAPVVTRLNKSMQDILKSPALQKNLAALGAETVQSTPEETTAFMKREITSWGEAVKTANVKLD